MYTQYWFFKWHPTRTNSKLFCQIRLLFPLYVLNVTETWQDDFTISATVRVHQLQRFLCMIIHHFQTKFYCILGSKMTSLISGSIVLWLEEYWKMELLRREPSSASWHDSKSHMAFKAFKTTKVGKQLCAAGEEDRIATAKGEGRPTKKSYCTIWKKSFIQKRFLFDFCDFKKCFDIR